MTPVSAGLLLLPLLLLLRFSIPVTQQSWYTCPDNAKSQPLGTDAAGYWRLTAFIHK